MRAHKSLFVMLGWLMLMLVLGACKPSVLAAQNAQDYIEAIRQGNIAEAEKHICPDASASAEFAAWTEEVDLTRVTEFACQMAEAQVECTFTLNSGEKAVVTFLIEEDKVCDVESIMLTQP